MEETFAGVSRAMDAQQWPEDLSASSLHAADVDFAGAGIPICIASLEHRNALEQRGSNYYQCVSTQSTLINICNKVIHLTKESGEKTQLKNLL